MKILILQITKCADCPHEMLALHGRGYCSRTGREMDPNTLPDWCPLDNAGPDLQRTRGRVFVRAGDNTRLVAEMRPTITQEELSDE